MTQSVAQPRLVIVAGAPGSGKTTLASEIAARRSIVMISKDEVKERLGDALGTGDREWSRKLGRATYVLLHAFARTVLDAGTDVLLEANFYRGLSDDDLRDLATRSRARIIVCRASSALRRARFASRGRTHGVHLDAHILEHEWPDDDSVFDIDIGVPRLVVDTNDGYDPELTRILAFARG